MSPRVGRRASTGMAIKMPDEALAYGEPYYWDQRYNAERKAKRAAEAEAIAAAAARAAELEFENWRGLRVALSDIVDAVVATHAPTMTAAATPAEHRTTAPPAIRSKLPNVV